MGGVDMTEMPETESFSANGPVTRRMQGAHPGEVRSRAGSAGERWRRGEGRGPRGRQAGEGGRGRDRRAGGGGVVSDEARWPGSPVPAGGRVAGYRLDEQIGRGGMAVVYRAYDLPLDRPGAINVSAPGR